MNVTHAAQSAARNSNASRKMNGTPVVRAVDMFTEPQIGYINFRAGNTKDAESILSDLLTKERAGFMLCNVFRDIKRTCERTLGIAV